MLQRIDPNLTIDETLVGWYVVDTENGGMYEVVGIRSGRVILDDIGFPYGQLQQGRVVFRADLARRFSRVVREGALVAA